MAGRSREAMGHTEVRDVRYRKGGNRELRLALWEAWGSKCYWCTKPTVFSSIQIDHIIPKDVGEPELRSLKHTHGLPHDFDLNDPQNLGPACVECNGPDGKRNRTYHAASVTDRLDRAAEHRAKVIDRVQRLGRSGKVAAHLLEAVTADFSDSDLRQEFLEVAPAVVRLLAVMDPQLLVDHQSFREVEVAVCEETGDYQRVDVTLDARGRSAVSTLEEDCDTELADLLQAPVVQLTDELRNRVTAGFEAIESSDPITAGPPTLDYLRIDVDSVDYRGSADGIEFTFNGTFEGVFTASVVRVAPDGEGTDDLQGDAVVNGTFSVVAAWDPTTELADVSAGDCTDETWEEDLHVA
ncbi:hypothetical protein ABZ930_26765 [Streptomyces sp. NPDC046716]|uniref:HNH endonuclease n=1 Tax=Streptomyces sp. NPDC046716 TaxID=3157093 RepID=UPI00340E3D1F